MQTPVADMIGAFSAVTSAIGAHPASSLALLVLAGLSAAVAIALFFGLFVATPIVWLARALRSTLSWIKRTDWRPLWSLVLVMLMLGAIGVMSVIGARAILRADPIAEIIFVGVLGVGIVVAGALTLLRLAIKARDRLLGRDEHR